MKRNGCDYRKELKLTRERARAAEESLATIETKLAGKERETEKRLAEMLSAHRKEVERLSARNLTAIMGEFSGHERLIAQYAEGLSLANDRLDIAAGTIDKLSAEALEHRQTIVELEQRNEALTAGMGRAAAELALTREQPLPPLWLRRIFHKLGGAIQKPEQTKIVNELLGRVFRWIHDYEAQPGKGKDAQVSAEAQAAPVVDEVPPTAPADSEQSAEQHLIDEPAQASA